MSDYSKSTNFTTKDTLPTGNAGKIVKGTELDTEFTAIASAVASKADVSSPALLGTPTAPTATTGSNTTQIATCAFVLANSVPSGIISLWSGTIASIPSGWYLCNGSNSTPDLRNKFIIGAYADDSSVAKTTITGSSTQTGGTKDAINVSHTHTATTTATDSGHSHTLSISGGSSITGLGGSGGSGWTGTNTGVTYVTTSGTNSSTATITAATTVASAGSDGTNQNLPPYYALAYIMKA
jgi:hypothetical protein